MITNSYPSKNIYLADDDIDDCLLFEDALKELSLDSILTTANDGQRLMQILDKTVPPPPDIIFLDLNMPRRNGFECLDEIRNTPKLKDIPVVIFSTTSQMETINKLYDKGANHYICKPSSFTSLKNVIKKVISINWQANKTQPPLNEFVLQP